MNTVGVFLLIGREGVLVVPILGLLLCNARNDIFRMIITIPGPFLHIWRMKNEEDRKAGQMQ